MSRYQNYRPEQMQDRTQEHSKEKEFNKTAPFFSVEMPRAFNGGTWDAKHLTSFLNKSNYSNWRGEQHNISKCSDQSVASSHKRCFSTNGDHFFRTTREDKNQSKIGFTPIFPLVSNVPLQQQKEATLSNFFQSSKEGKSNSMKLRCAPDDVFRFQGNAVKFKSTDPITLQHEQLPQANVTGFHKERMNRLIDRRHPHGMTGIDHPLNPQSKYYTPFEEKIRIRQEPNSGRTFLIDRDWKQKGRSVPPVDDWKQRKTITIRRFRNQNSHGYNILTNRAQ